MLKVCADESSVASSFTCDKRLARVFLEMREPFADYHSARMFLREKWRKTVKNEEENEEQQEGKKIEC